jgi:hypothetical protein
MRCPRVSVLGAARDYYYQIVSFLGLGFPLTATELIPSNRRGRTVFALANKSKAI